MDEDVERSSSCIIIFSNIIVVIVIFNSAMESTLFSFTFVPFTVFDLRFNAKIPLLIRLDVSVSVCLDANGYSAILLQGADPAHQNEYEIICSRSPMD